MARQYRVSEEKGRFYAQLKSGFNWLDIVYFSKFGKDGHIETKQSNLRGNDPKRYVESFDTKLRALGVCNEWEILQKEKEDRAKDKVHEVISTKNGLVLKREKR